MTWTVYISFCPKYQVIDSRGVTVISKPPIMKDVLTEVHNSEAISHLSVVIFGASGDLAKKKTM